MVQWSLGVFFLKLFEGVVVTWKKETPLLIEDSANLPTTKQRLIEVIPKGCQLVGWRCNFGCQFWCQFSGTRKRENSLVMIFSELCWGRAVMPSKKICHASVDLAILRWWPFWDGEKVTPTGESKRSRIESSWHLCGFGACGSKALGTY